MPADDEVARQPSDDEVVEAAVDAAENTVFSRYSRSAVRDLDVTVRFDDGVLDVDVYLNVGSETDDEREEERVVAEDAAQAAGTAVDQLFEAADS